MKFEKTDYAAVLLLAGILVLTVYGFTQLSGDIVVNFDSQGQPNGYVNVVPGLLIAPLLAVGMLAMFKLLPSIDPLGKNYEKFSEIYSVLMLVLIGISGYIQLMIILWNTGYTYNPSQFVIPVVVAAYYTAGKVMEKAERNWFVGIRTPWTLSSDVVWKKTHEKTAPLFKLSAIIALFAFFLPGYEILIYVVPAVAASIFATIYSYMAYQEEN